LRAAPAAPCGRACGAAHMASDGEDAAVVPDPVASKIRAFRLGAFQDADYAEAFLQSWTDADREVFKAHVEDMVHKHKGCTLNELNDKVKRSTSLLKDQHGALFVEDGKLSVPARLHGTLKALRKCQDFKQAEKPQAPTASDNWLKARAF